MNVNARDYVDHILIRMRQWREVAGMGINQSDRTKARKNFRVLVRKYPEIARAHGFDLESVQA
jgi:hypothetical protein